MERVDTRHKRLITFKKVSIVDVKREISSQKPSALEQQTNRQMGVVYQEAINQLKALMDQGVLNNSVSL